MVGDFNLPEIDWNTLTADTNSVCANHLLTCTSSYGLYQLVFEPTRKRNGAESVLDLVFASEGLIMEGIHHSSPLGKSDHDVLTWSTHEDNDNLSDQKEDNIGLDLELARDILGHIDWYDILGELSVNEAGIFFLVTFIIF